ncbi:galactose oxidase [Mucilaginibacter sp. X5P1]|uniref:galactose oxidase n=1 Tax=Mucilaginibacter sp. X5P1 TaxID=2723088 RepID=UPI001607C947|nr:galactose oxidase [Mucilaginibacter sp. X5P1]MBB6140369.1 DNA-binding SARP family transcriptional activator [Mucilaginibacter sp. X5P1]
MRKLYPGFKIIVLTAFICILNKNCFGQNYGLGFSSHEVFQDKRTSLDLCTNKSLCLNGNFDLSFDLSFLPYRATYFGYIVRIIDDDDRNFDLIYSAEDSKNHFNVIAGDKLTNIKFDIPLNKLFSQWNKLNILFDVEKDQLVFSDGLNTFVEKGLHLKKNGCYHIFFGTNNYKQFETTDIPPIKLRNISISQNKVLKYSWPLNEGMGTIVHEVIAQQNGSIANPLWISAMHHNWQKTKDITVQGVASTAFDRKNEILYIVGKDSVYSYSVNSSAMTSSPNVVKPNLNQGNQSVYNPYDNSLYNFFPDQKTVARYSFENKSWDKKFTPNVVTGFWHANKMISGMDTSLYLFGGYGQLQYKNTIQQYTFKTQKWQQVKYKGDFFMPRYLSALGASASGDTVYVIGGYGNSSGLQILNPKNIYSMMRFTVKNRTFKKLFDLKVNNEDFAFASSLIINDKEKTYYGLVFPQNKYNSSLQLIKGSLNDPSYKILTSAIPYSFNDIHSFADLYYCPASNKFVVVTLLRLENDETKVNIYTLLGPPVDIAENLSLAKNDKFWYFIISMVLALAAGGFIYYKRHKTKNATAPYAKSLEEPLPVLPSQDVVQPQPSYITESITSLSDVQNYESDIPLKNAILLFGDLQVFDADGADITKHFTPLIKELFLLILLYSIKRGRGLSSEKLNEILWFDKSAKSARNNRSVNIAKLKSLLDKVQDCHLSKDTGYWKIDVDYDKIYVDYYNYLNIVKDKKKLDEQKIKSLFEITRRGNFLSNSDYEWLDTFKAEISNEVIDTFLHYAQSSQPYNAEFLIEIANFIFYFDPVNEESMILKCNALSTLGKHSLAKNTFECFVKEYKIIYDEDFKRDFHDILVQH